MPDHLTHLLRNLYAGQEATVRTRHGTDWFQIGKGVHQGCIFSPCLFNVYTEYIMQNARLDESQGRIKLAGRSINNLRYTGYIWDISRWYHCNGRKWRGTKETLDEGIRGEWKSWLKTQHWKHEDHSIQSHHFKANRTGKSGSSERSYFLGLPNHCGRWLKAWN